MPPEDAWGGDSEKEKDVSAAQTRENPAQTASPNPPPAAASPKPAPVAASPSPKPAPVTTSPSVRPPPVATTPSGRPPPLPAAATASAAAPAQVVTDANSLRTALEEILGPMQRSIDDLTVRLARERVDRKEAIEKLERTVARVASATPPPAQVAPAQPFQVSPSANPPPVAPVAAAPAPSPAPPAAASPVPPPVAAKAPSPKPPPVVPTEAPSQPLNLDVIEAAPRRIELDKYSTDLSFDLPPGLDTGKRRKRMLVIFFLLVIGGVVAIVASAIVSQSRGAGHAQLETRAGPASPV